MITFSLGDSSAPTCEDCGYVGVPTDHRTEGEESETWDDALGRFREEGEAPMDETVALEAGERTYYLSEELRERFESLTENQRRVVEELLAEPTPTDPDRTHAAIAEAAEASPSYVGSIVRERADLLGAIVATARAD
jgi:hypothetical protein